ncbi:hypothetical protein [Rhodopirellula sp. MGV]|uniref:hypothetical protein n=1 Tax=Rhodopirellula sp. MGV TaxID=2023130 RepID=UPI00117B6391|nr:hypothetical protein [Rhodopirellula sp. MGV]
MTDVRKPIDTIRLPGGLKATIWLNTTEKGKTFASTEISRTYKTKDGFGDSHSFGHDDLLKVARLAEIAFDRITQIKAAEKADGGAQ